jgi:hypothetical protein
MVRIEAIEASIEVLDTMGLENVEKEFIPPFLKMLNLRNLDEDFAPRMSKMIGKISHKLMINELHLKYKEQIFNYFVWMFESQDDKIRLNAAYNLPSF